LSSSLTYAEIPPELGYQATMRPFFSDTTLMFFSLISLLEVIFPIYWHLRDWFPLWNSHYSLQILFKRDIWTNISQKQNV